MQFHRRILVVLVLHRHMNIRITRKVAGIETVYASVGVIKNEVYNLYFVYGMDGNSFSSNAEIKAMSQQLKPKFVAGIVITDPNLSKEQARENPYAFWEIDSLDEKIHALVLKTYAKHDIDVVSHKLGKGWHYFGDKVTREKWKLLHDELVSFSGNEKFPALTLRISKKYRDEEFERPEYHNNKYPPSNWARALMHYLNKEMKNENSTNLHQSMKDCSLQRYFICVVYPICPLCLVSGFDDTIEHMKKEHGETNALA